MTIKTSNDLIPSLRGAAFRRTSHDGRSWCVRAIKTLRTLRHRQPLADAPLAEGQAMATLPRSSR